MSQYDSDQCPYKICGKKFKFKNSLVSHIKIHTGEKKYKCNYCDKRFITNGNRKIHEKRHFNIKIQQCMKCGMQFFRNSKVKTHQENCDGQIVQVEGHHNIQDLKWIKFSSLISEVLPQNEECFNSWLHEWLPSSFSKFENIYRIY